MSAVVSRRSGASPGPGRRIAGGEAVVRGIVDLVERECDVRRCTRCGGSTLALLRVGLPRIMLPRCRLGRRRVVIRCAIGSFAHPVILRRGWKLLVLAQLRLLYHSGIVDEMSGQGAQAVRRTARRGHHLSSRSSRGNPMLVTCACSL